MRWMSGVGRMVLVAATLCAAGPVLGQQVIVVATGTTTPNQAATAHAVAGFTAANPIHAALTLLPSDDAFRAGLDSLSGEIHASLRTAMASRAAGVASAALAHDDGETGDGRGLWGQLFVGTAKDSGPNGAADVRRHYRGGVGGINVALSDVARFGVAGGYTRDRMTVGALAIAARLKTVHLLGTVSAEVGPLHVSAGAGHDWVKISTNRNIGFTGFSDFAMARYHGRVMHGFAQVELPVALGDLMVKPFAGVVGFRTRTGGFIESGGPAALADAARKDGYVQSTVGLKAAAPIAAGVSARGRVGWEHVFDDRIGTTRLSFLAGGPTFGINGTSLSRNAAAASLALTYAPNASVKVSTGYAGHFGDSINDNAGRVALSVSF